MARRKTKTTRRRSPKRISLIDAGASLIVANAGTRAFFGTGIVPFLTEGWITDPSSSWTSSSPGQMGSASSYAVSLSEIVRSIVPGGLSGGYSAYQSGGYEGLKAVVSRSMREYGPQAVATTIFVPIGAKLLKRVARKPIADANKLLKWSGIQALGVKV